jgi:hypothetical protein
MPRAACFDYQGPPELTRGVNTPGEYRAFLVRFEPVTV